MQIQIQIQFNDKPNTIYIDRSQQYPIEFMFYWRCDFIVDSFFSVISTYAYEKRFFRRNQNKVEIIKPVNGAVNNKKRVLISRINDKISSLQTKLNRVMKVVKIKNKLILIC